MATKKKSLQQLQQQIDKFNEKHPVGSTVKLKLDSQEIKSVTVQHKATILGGHSAVGWFSDVSGCYLLDRVID